MPSTQEILDYEKIISTLDICSPLDILTLFHPDINSGAIILNNWQREFLLKLSTPSTKDHPNRNILIAANGSGKSQFVLAPWAVWALICFSESETVITSASGAQLDKQAGRFIKMLSNRANIFFKEQLGFTKDVLDVQVRKIENRFNGSFIDLFATDESGKAEGWHAIKVGGKFMIGIDEGKSVSDDIYTAFDRCRGFTDILNVSSTGTATGTLYKDTINPKKVFDVKYVYASDCNHISESEKQSLIDKHGENDPLVQSTLYCRWISGDDTLVLQRENIFSCIDTFNLNKQKDFGLYRAGLDLSAGGDETVLSIWLGCRLIQEYTYRISYAPLLVDKVIDHIRQWKIKAENVWYDDGGMGRIYGDMFRERGFAFNRVLNQARAIDNTRYANRGTELWFNFKRFILENQVWFDVQVNTKLLDQLSARWYKIRQDNKMILESKQEARAKGHCSPDRADGAVLAWAGLVYPLDELKLVPKETGKSPEEFTAWFNEQQSLGLLGKTNQVHNENVVDGKYVNTRRFTFSPRKINKFVNQRAINNTFFN